MDAQEFFDQVRDHLLAQGERSVLTCSSGRAACAYRSKTGLKCAVGCLIRDDEYTEEMEYQTVTTLSDAGVLPRRLNGHLLLLESLQWVHDSCDPASWETDLRDVARKHGLEWH